MVAFQSLACRNGRTVALLTALIVCTAAWPFIGPSKRHNTEPRRHHVPPAALKWPGDGPFAPRMAASTSAIASRKRLTREGPAATSFLFALADAFNPKRIRWVEWNRALKAAEEGGGEKPIMMMIHKSWCAACKSLRPKFNAPEIELLSEYFIMANVEDDEEPTDDKYAPQGAYSPRIMFLDGTSGKVLDVANHMDPSHLHFYGSVSEIVRGMTEALRVSYSGRGGQLIVSDL